MRYLVEVICDSDGVYEFSFTSTYETYEDAIAAAGKEKDGFLLTEVGRAYRSDSHAGDVSFMDSIAENGVVVLQDATGNDRRLFRVVGIH